jgi:acyl dehydratase
MFKLHAQYDLGSVRFTEAEIIDFAMRYDPLDFHLSVDGGRRSIFKSLVTSGPQPFHHFYKNHWIQRFGKTVMAGLGIDNWRLLKPVHADEDVHCIVTITELTSHPEKGSVTVRWRFEFQNAKGELFQHLEMIVLHKE